ncbi:MAG: hypothetical protein U0R19_19335 [Bryobacteraceae bacterium]
MSPDVEARFQRIEAAMEFMAARQQYHDDALDRMEAAINANNEGIAKLETHMAKLTETMDRLAHIVIRHEERLDDIQGEQ